MSDSPTVHVRGTSRLTVAPEIATVRIEVLAVEPDRLRALRHASEGTATVQAIATSYGTAISRAETHAVYVRPIFRPDSKRAKVASYAASVGISLEVSDLGVLGDLVLRIGEQDRVTLHGPVWALRPDSPRYRDVRLAAVRDARARAAEYAEAVGGHLTGLVSVTDVALAEPWGPGSTGQVMYARASSSSLADDVTLDLTPEAQTVSGEVDVRFLMSAPLFDA